MSDTDDTDDLLLLPPDLFVIESEAELIDTFTNGPYFNIVDSLITQVHKLQSRVNSIEACDLINSSFKTMDGSQRFSSSDDILKDKDGYWNSTYSTPQKPRTRYRVHPQAQSPQKPLTRFTQITPRKQISQDYDDFMNNAGDRRVEDARKENPEDDIVEINGKVINLSEIEHMLEEIETQKRKNEVRLRDKEESLQLQKQYAWRMGDDDRTLPPSSKCNEDMSQMSKTSLTGKLSTIAPKSSTISNHSSTSNVGDKSSLSSTDSSQLTTRYVSNNQLGIYENLTSKENASHEEAHNGVQLMSLRELWGRNQVSNELSKEILKEKLEEEKLRRQHCEEIIQDLQTRSLECEERLAVAVQVDKAKDKALLKFNDSWDKVTMHLKSLNEVNNKLEHEIQDMHLQNEQNMEDCTKKLKHYETEASKALNLAHANHEKLSVYQTQNAELLEKLESVQKRFANLTETYDSELRKSKQLNEIIVQKEIELTENKSVLTDSRNEVANSKQAIELCQVEFANMKSQYTHLELLLTEKQATLKDLETKINTLQADNENLKILHSDAQKELSTMTQTMDKTKCELRDFYQQQVELLVQDKLKEFQRQLDKAETSLNEEIKKRELSIAKTAATHIQQITEKHNLEISLMEEKQKEEIKFYQMQLQRAQQHIDNQHSKIKNFQERRTHLTQQLHKVMEVQWMEALKIINNTKSPLNSTPIDNTIDQLRTLKTKSHNNLEEVLSDRGDDGDKNSGNGAAFIDYNNQLFHETPVSSKVYHKGSTTTQSANDLQKYVQLLLQKPTSTTTQVDQKEIIQSEEMDDKLKTSQARRLMKPPWK